MFKSGCLKEISGEWYLVGTKIKFASVEAPTEGDLWPAIPILVDSIIALEMFEKITSNPYLLSSFECVVPGKIPLPYTTCGLNDVFRKYVEIIDQDGVWSSVMVSPNRYRHTMAYHLARGDLGLAYVSHFLKHLNYRFSNTPSDVTFAYGTIDKLMAERAVYRTEHARDATRKLFTPNTPVAGGGAAAFRKRREGYFAGCAQSGYSEEETLAMLTEQAEPFVNVGLAYCGGKRDLIDASGRKQKPPCTGSLQCNPKNCSNSLITQGHARLWLDVVRVNTERAADPQMAHQKENLEIAIAEGRAVLAELGIEA
jgi:hypothetical protein